MTFTERQLVSLLRRAMGPAWLARFIKRKVQGMNTQRIAQLEAEHRQLKERLRLARNELAGAEADQRRQRDAISANRLTNAMATVRAAELAVEGIEQDLERARTARVEITGSRYSLEQRRAQLVRQNENAAREYEQQCEAIRAAHRGEPEEHIKIHINNAMGSSAYWREKARRERQTEIDSIDAQLAELDRREAKGAA